MLCRKSGEIILSKKTRTVFGLQVVNPVSDL